MEECIFCKIAKKEINAEALFEDDDIIAFRDIKPIAPIHVLLIPKRHIGSVAEISEDDALLMGKLIFQAKRLARELGTEEGGYKLLFRVGSDGGQEVPHIHLHLIGGAPLFEEIRPI
ncbi:MAG TPA: histidine triad nucleotide-binding protein [Candidatus Moranbacteria bacterium]|nr:MAG: Bis(5'-nucleosyl)-tetraphosphatase (Asymmetrical) [Candidatus Moranbacteria bacterium GW2011_GWC2_45_10]KKT95267.1 MAG: Bis(5'-nucleosyl)-tetraphosphatase (Asymmetrical) [Parcubacteria group bacterium GW2011_GWC1_45_14]HAV10958.1 histidine triad nucleotide-binding protein [Candidatus Moranbacteria bacterium]